MLTIRQKWWRLGGCQQFGKTIVCFAGSFFLMSGLCWLLSYSVIIQHGLSCRANAAWDYSASPLKPETRDSGECVRNVLIALCEECPSADSSSDFISGVWDWYFRRGRGRAREGEGDRTSKQRREKLRCSYALENWEYEFFDILWAYQWKSQQTQLSRLINVTWRQ